MIRLSRAACAAFLVFTAAGVQAQPGRGGLPGQGPATAPTPEAPARASAAERPSAPFLDNYKQTQHTGRFGGQQVAYTATAGTLALKSATGKPRANVFFVAYTKDGAAPGTRPITFAYNGGPGSASVYVHLGLFGPKRVQMADDGFQPAPPYELVDNEDSVLDVSDVVVIDAVTTGYSRMVEGEDGKNFHGVRQDIEAFSDFIRLYLTRFNRFASPKYLMGESYGTVRSAGVGADLQARHGIELNGIVLISSVIDFATLSEAPGNEINTASFFPTYTADAWYHKRLAADLQAMDIRRVVEESRKFTWGEYMTALIKGSRLTPAERKDIATKASRLSGLSADFIEQANLRVSPARFRKELLRDKRLMVGRLDGRYTGVDRDAAGESQEFDPSNTALQGAYSTIFMEYVRNTLKWETDLFYPTSANVRPWQYDEGRYLNLTDNLRTAMTRNPTLNVMVVNGYYDMATPFAGSEYTFDHLAFDKSVTDRVSFTYYEGGHMMYTRPNMLKALKTDIASFVNRTKDGKAK
jgi:carboxypeptidase C (cathepsin A)